MSVSVGCRFGTRPRRFLADPEHHDVAASLDMQSDVFSLRRGLQPGPFRDRAIPFAELDAPCGFRGELPNVLAVLFFGCASWTPHRRAGLFQRAGGEGRYCPSQSSNYVPMPLYAVEPTVR